nr:hypothetical protein [Tanacetum cinerariifolium]
FEIQDKSYVYVLDSNNVAHTRSFVPGTRTGGNYVVKSGLKHGERVVYEGTQQMKDGMKVVPRKADVPPQTEAPALTTYARTHRVHGTPYVRHLHSPPGPLAGYLLADNLAGRAGAVSAAHHAVPRHRAALRDRDGALHRGQRRGEKFIYNFADINILQELKRINGVGLAEIMGAREYSMRVWLKPDRMAAYNVGTEDVVAAIRAENVEAAPGKSGESSGRKAHDLQYV